MTDEEKLQFADLEEAALAALCHAQESGGTNGYDSWRGAAQSVLTRVDMVIPSGTPLAVRKAVYSAVYPFGERSMHPYKVWLQEVAAHLGLHHPETHSSTLLIVRKALRRRAQAQAQAAPDLFAGEPIL